MKKQVYLTENSHGLENYLDGAKTIPPEFTVSASSERVKNEIESPTISKIAILLHGFHL